MRQTQFFSFFGLEGTGFFAEFGDQFLQAVDALWFTSKKHPERGALF